MKDSAKLRRQRYIIRCLDQPYTYPSLNWLSNYLRDQGIDYASEASVERDITAIRADYDITITYDRRRRGYYLDLPTDEDVSDFRAFVWLLERRERLDFLTQSGRPAGRYLQLEQPDHGATSQFRGIDWLAPLWNALQRQLVITFHYRTYNDGPDGQRLVEPGLLFEYRNRWYLDGYDLDRQAERTFGLDRISDLELTPQAVQPDRDIDYRANRQHVIGVTAPPGAPVERVVLRFAKPEAEYVRSLPLHGSQEIINETDTSVDVRLQVILNHELQREILAYGEFVKVLEPLGLRELIAGRVARIGKRYGNDSSG